MFGGSDVTFLVFWFVLVDRCDLFFFRVLILGQTWSVLCGICTIKEDLVSGYDHGLSVCCYLVKYCFFLGDIFKSQA